MPAGSGGRRLCQDFFVLLVKPSYDRFDSSFKNKYVLPALQSTGMFEELEYLHHGGLSYDEIRDSAVVLAENKNISIVRIC